MKVQVLLFVGLFIANSAVDCFSQDNRSPSAHPPGKDAKGPLSNAPAALSTLTDMFKSLESARTNSQKADIYFSISRFYADRLKIDSALFFSEKIKEESLAGNYEPGMGKHYLSRSYALYYRSRRDPEGLEKAIVIFARYKDHLFSGLAYRQKAREFDQDKDHDLSRKNYHVAVSFLLKAGETRELQRVYYELGRSFYQSFETDSAVFYLITALELAEKLNDTGRIFNASGILGESYLASGDLNKAEQYFKYAMDVRTASTSRIEIRNRLSSYAGCLILQGKFDKADAVIRECEVINEKIGDNWGTINLYHLKGIYAYHRENYPVALDYLRNAFSRINEMKAFAFDIKNICSYLARTEYKMGMYDSAISHLLYAWKLADQLKFGADILETSLMTAQCYEKKGNIDSAYYYFLVYDHLKDSILTSRKERTVIELTTRYETGKKEQQIQLLQKENELAAFQLRLKNEKIEKQTLADTKRTQQLMLLSQQNEISRLEAAQKTLALQNQDKEMLKKQSEMELLSKESQLRTTIAAKESQQKKIAYGAALIVLVFGGIAFFRYRQSRKLGKQLAASLVSLHKAQAQLIKTEKEKEADNIRVRISRDIHDEVGATLSGVALFSEIAKQKMIQHETNDVHTYLDHISANSKEMVEKMSDIVWTISPDNDSFDRIITKLQSFAVNLCAGKGIKLHLDIDDSIRSYYPSMQVRKNIYMLIKEAINNAVKYSEGKNLHLSMHSKQDVITAEVKDDGKGFDKEAGHEGNGLQNMRARAADLGADINIDTARGKGTSIRLRFNFHPDG